MKIIYGKIFDSIYDGTLAEDWRALITFQQFIVLCDADGFVDMTPLAISKRTGIPIEHIKAGIEILEKTDKYSRTPDQEGRRIELIDLHRPWGWHIVNHKYYRDLRVKEDRKEYMKSYMTDRRKQKSLQKLTEVNKVNSKQSLAMLANTDTDTYTNKRSRDLGQNKNRFDLFWSSYPKKVKRKKAHEIWKRRKLDLQAERLIADVKNRSAKDSRWLDGYIPDPTTYLNGDLWEDDLQVKTREPEQLSKSQVLRVGSQKGVRPRPGETMEDYSARVRTTRETV